MASAALTTQPAQSLGGGGGRHLVTAPPGGWRDRRAFSEDWPWGRRGTGALVDVVAWGALACEATLPPPHTPPLWTPQPILVSTWLEPATWALAAPGKFF